MSRILTHPPSRKLQPDGALVGGWWHESSGGRIVCDLCPRACALRPGDRGFCFVRENRDGQMVLTTYGRSTGFCVDPIEKKPLNHFFPGTSVLSFGTAGCNLGCKFCQNWSISKSREVRQLSERATPDTIAAAARELGCQSVAFTYNDPVIWAEYAIDTARACHELGIRTVAVTAGYITQLARQAFFELIDAANVDLKAFTEHFYQRLTLSHLQPVLETLSWLRRETNVWVEITNLVIPQANDGDDEFRRICDWILAELGDRVPLHFTAFHPDFRLRDRGATPTETLLRAYDTAREAGVKYVYVGNVDDLRHQSTYCPSCGQVVVERNWYQLGRYKLNGNRCAWCGTSVDGCFARQPGDWGRRRLPVQISQFAPSPATHESLSPAVSPLDGDETMAHPETSEPSSTDDVSRPELTETQEKTVLRAVSEIIQAAVCGEHVQLSDATLDGAAAIPLFGCFVSIKRQGHLRGCCGFLGRRASLVNAVRESAVTSATGDVRLPSVSISELPYLQLEVWLLYGRQPIRSQGRARIQEVEIGRHGLQIQRGQARGLLLPGVAQDHELDAEEFLQQVCIKAGLPPTAWREEDALVSTFEGQVVRGTFDRSVLLTPEGEAEPRFRNEELEQLVSFCRDNVLAISRGAVPTYYLAGCSDGSVHGINLHVEVAGRHDPLQLARLSLRKPVPVQASLYQLCETAGNRLRADGLQQLTADDVQIHLGLLNDPAVHGTVAEPDLAGLDPARRALLVSQGARSAWMFDPQASAEELLQVTTKRAEITLPESAAVHSFLAQVNQVPMTAVNVPQSQRGPTVRPPAVAGLFYPKEAEQLSRMLDQLVPESPVPRQRYSAALVPHAGWVYSGRIAADVLRRIEIPDTVIVIGPKHTPLGVEWAVAPCQTWSLPGINIPSDLELAEQLCETIPGLRLDAQAHQQEHAIEVALPLLARFAPHVRVVGIAVGHSNLDRCREFGHGLAEVLDHRSESTLLVISSDMNHFASDAETRRVDAQAIAALESLDPGNLYHTVRNHNITMCGVLPACIVLECLQKMGQLTRSEKVAYGTSGDVSGDTSRVVGYAGMLFA